MKQLRWLFAFAAIILAIGTVTASKQIENKPVQTYTWYETDPITGAITGPPYLGTMQQAASKFGCNQGLRHCAVAVNSQNQPIEDSRLFKN